MSDEKKIYVNHATTIVCDKALRSSVLCVPLSHGVILKNYPQLKVSDSKELVNVLSFGGCTSPENPAVREAAEKILEEVQEETSGFVDNVISFAKSVASIFKKKDTSEKKEIDEEFIKQCAGECRAKINIDWIDGKDNVLIDEEQVLLNTCKLSCVYGGNIEIIVEEESE